MQTEYIMEDSLSKQRSDSEYCLINIFSVKPLVTRNLREQTDWKMRKFHFQICFVEICT
jgi:hypothetical protein